MNHLVARQRKSDGRWDYTYNGVAWGYCREYDPIPENVGWMSAEEVRKHNEKTAVFKDKHHDCGHATREEAEACYKQYMLDQHLRLQPTEPENANQQFRCKVCKKFTACHAFVGAYQIFDLCPEHQTREEVEKLFAVGESWES